MVGLLDPGQNLCSLPLPGLRLLGTPQKDRRFWLLGVSVAEGDAGPIPGHQGTPTDMLFLIMATVRRGENVIHEGTQIWKCKRKIQDEDRTS